MCCGAVRGGFWKGCFVRMMFTVGSVPSHSLSVSLSVIPNPLCAVVPRILLLM